MKDRVNGAKSTSRVHLDVLCIRKVTRTKRLATLVVASLFLFGPESISTVYAVECIVHAHSTARLGAGDKGIIARIAVDRGDKIKKGQVIAELESSAEDSRETLSKMRAESDIAIMAARKAAEAAEAKAERLSKLREQRVISQSEVDEIVLEAQSARLQEEQAVLDKAIAAEEAEGAAAARERKTVRAPFDGVVVRRLLSAGELYNEQDPIVIVSRTDPLYVETYLPVANLKDVKRGTSIEVNLETGKIVDGMITVIDPTLDAATGTFGIRIEVDNSANAIIAGQRCTVDF